MKSISAFHIFNIFHADHKDTVSEELEARQSVLHLAKSSPQKGCEPKSCIDVSSGHTPINCTSRRNSFDVEHDLTTTVAASENTDGFHQEAAASGFPQPVLASLVNFGLAPTCGPTQGNWCEATRQMQVLDFVERKEETELWKVCKNYRKGESYIFTLNRKVNWLFKENVQAQKRLSEAEAEMPRRNWEQKF